MCYVERVGDTRSGSWFTPFCINYATLPGSKNDIPGLNLWFLLQKPGEEFKHAVNCVFAFNRNFQVGFAVGLILVNEAFDEMFR